MSDIRTRVAIEIDVVIPRTNSLFPLASLVPAEILNNMIRSSIIDATDFRNALAHASNASSESQKITRFTLVED